MPLSRAKLKVLTGEASWIFVGQIASVLGALVLVRALTEQLTPTQYGELALALTIAGLVNQLITGGISGGIGRYYSIAAEKGDLEAYFNDSLRILGLAILAILLLGIIGTAVLGAASQQHLLGLLAAMIVLSILSGINSALNGIQNAARQRSVVALHTGIEAWLRIALTLGIIFLVGGSALSATLGYVLAAAIIVVSQAYFIRRVVPVQIHSTDRQRGRWTVDIWNFARPLSLWGIFTWGQHASDRWALEFFSGTEDVGAYAVLSQLGFAPMSLAASLLISLIAPIMYQQAGDAQDKERVRVIYSTTRNLSLFVLGLTAAGAIIAAGLHNWMFALLVNERFHGYSDLMPWLVIAAGLQASHHILGIRISATLKVNAILIPQILSALTFLVLNCLGAYLAGVKGLVYALTFSSLLYFLWMLVLSESFLHTGEKAKDN